MFDLVLPGKDAFVGQALCTFSSKNKIIYKRFFQQQCDNMQNKTILMRFEI
jgi:hypothetical protein